MFDSYFDSCFLSFRVYQTSLRDFRGECSYVSVSSLFSSADPSKLFSTLLFVEDDHAGCIGEAGVDPDASGRRARLRGDDGVSVTSIFSKFASTLLLIFGPSFVAPSLVGTFVSARSFVAPFASKNSQASLPKRPLAPRHPTAWLGDAPFSMHLIHRRRFRSRTGEAILLAAAFSAKRISSTRLLRPDDGLARVRFSGSCEYRAVVPIAILPFNGFTGVRALNLGCLLKVFRVEPIVIVFSEWIDVASVSTSSLTSSTRPSTMSHSSLSASAVRFRALDFTGMQKLLLISNSLPSFSSTKR
mmetsp:Transcript_10349/g.24649  ORF Transcript_10349/g.24649 Transcript_10349/m.24649 type:complete len:301 (+) Transcript_10349:180-1082(+)